MKVLIKMFFAIITPIIWIIGGIWGILSMGYTLKESFKIFIDVLKSTPQYIKIMFDIIDGDKTIETDARIDALVDEIFVL